MARKINGLLFFFSSKNINEGLYLNRILKYDPSFVRVLFINQNTVVLVLALYSYSLELENNQCIIVLYMVPKSDDYGLNSS